MDRVSRENAKSSKYVLKTIYLLGFPFSGEIRSIRNKYLLYFPGFTIFPLKGADEDLNARPFKPTLINALISTTASRGKPAAPPFAKVAKL